MYRHFFKRFLDIILSVIGIIVLAIPMLVIAVIIKIDSPGPVLFRQKRVGIHKSAFTILKFRSMPVFVPHDVPAHNFDEEDSLSRWQRIMRRYCIDELPQLFCILSGKMSIVGPRPVLWTGEEELIAQRDRYGANDIKPGLTGWAQINGRTNLDIPKKAVLDGEYVDKLKSGRLRGFAMDIRCFFGTIWYLLKSDSAPVTAKPEPEQEPAQEIKQEDKASSESILK